MFLGTYTPRLDEKGRLVIPAKWRDQLAGGVVVTKSEETALVLMTQARFEALSGASHEATVAGLAQRNYNRIFFGSASDEVPDKQGRITVPSSLREYARLDKAVVLLGVNTHVEIWDVDQHRAWDDAVTGTYSEISEAVAPSRP